MIAALRTRTSAERVGSPAAPPPHPPFFLLPFSEKKDPPTLTLPSPLPSQKMKKSYPLQQSVLTHDKMDESHRILCSDFELYRANTLLPNEATFIQEWNNMMMTRYANMKREKEWRREALLRRVMLVYSLHLPQLVADVVCEHLKPGPPPPPLLRRYTNRICAMCGDSLAYIRRPLLHVRVRR